MIRWGGERIGVEVFEKVKELSGFVCVILLQTGRVLGRILVSTPDVGLCSDGGARPNGEGVRSWAFCGIG